MGEKYKSFTVNPFMWLGHSDPVWEFLDSISHPPKIPRGWWYTGKLLYWEQWDGVRRKKYADKKKNIAGVIEGNPHQSHVISQLYILRKSNVGYLSIQKEMGQLCALSTSISRGLYWYSQIEVCQEIGLVNIGVYCSQQYNGCLCTLGL